jgi:lipoyl-dependent peroxiredoxin
MIRKAKAVWRGTGRAGNGNLSTDSGVLANTPYSFKTRFENEKGTNPEELIAAAHAGYFTMALAFGMQGAGFTPTELSTEAAVTLQPEGQEFRISRSALTLRAKVPNLDETKFADLARERREELPSLQGSQGRDRARRQADLRRPSALSFGIPYATEQGISKRVCRRCRHCGRSKERES